MKDPTFQIWLGSDCYGTRLSVNEIKNLVKSDWKDPANQSVGNFTAYFDPMIGGRTLGSKTVHPPLIQLGFGNFNENVTSTQKLDIGCQISSCGCGIGPRGEINLFDKSHEIWKLVTFEEFLEHLYDVGVRCLSQGRNRPS